MCSEPIAELADQLGCGLLPSDTRWSGGHCMCQSCDYTIHRQIRYGLLALTPAPQRRDQDGESSAEPECPQQTIAMLAETLQSPQSLSIGARF